MCILKTQFSNFNGIVLCTGDSSCGAINSGTLNGLADEEGLACCLAGIAANHDIHFSGFEGPYHRALLQDRPVACKTCGGIVTEEVRRDGEAHLTALAGREGDTLEAPQFFLRTDTPCHAVAYIQLHHFGACASAGVGYRHSRCDGLPIGHW